MGFRAVDEVFRLMPAGMTPAERLVLVAIAQNIRDDHAGRETWKDFTSEHLAERTGLTGIGSLGNVLRRLARRGFEVRVQVGTDRLGRPLYGVPGQPSRFRLPAFDVPVEGGEGVSVDGGEVSRGADLGQSSDGPKGSPEAGLGQSRDGARSVEERGRPVEELPLGVETPCAAGEIGAPHNHREPIEEPTAAALEGELGGVREPMLTAAEAVAATLAERDERQKIGDQVTSKYRPAGQPKSVTPARPSGNVPDRAPSVPSSGPVESERLAVEEFDVERVRAEVTNGSDGWPADNCPVWNALNRTQQVAVLGRMRLVEPIWVQTLRTLEEQDRRHARATATSGRMAGPDGQYSPPEDLAPVEWLLGSFLDLQGMRMPEKSAAEWGRAIEKLLAEGADLGAVWSGLKLCAESPARPEWLYRRVSDAVATYAASRRHLALVGAA